MTYNDIIRKKRDGGELTESEINYLISGVVSGDMPDYQLSAFLMATYFKSMTPAETALLTDAMANSGDTLDLSEFGELSADKHSTGGVGDKTSLIVAPIVASLGAVVAKMSGRALGHTGGTVDKLESIPGYKTELHPSEFISQSKKIGLALVGQSGHLAPADKTMYALRDVTSTVDSIPLIASSIMSKKLAAGAHNIVLDVKFGSGAFMNRLEDATELARAMVDIGNRCGRRVRAVLSDMDTPLGFAIGNVLEVREAVDVLRGAGPDDLREVSTTLAGVLISLVRNISVDDGISLAREALASGAAYTKFKEWIVAQGGDVRYITAPELFGEAPVCVEVRAEASGYISRMNTEKIGLTSSRLGAGREKKGDTIDPLAGIMLKKKTGDKVDIGDVVAVLYTSSPELAAEGARSFASAYEITKETPPSRELISDII